MSINRVVLVGRLTRDPELKYTPKGLAVASMSIAVDRYTKNEAGEYETDFFNITAWQKTAEYANNYLKKGRLIAVDGRIQNRSWVDQTSGQKRTATDIVAESLQGLDRPKDGEASEPSDYGAPAESYSQPAQNAPTSASAPRASAPAPRQTRPTPPPSDDIDESDPFADE